MEAEALTAKAAESMARYGIDRARLAAGDDPTRDPPVRPGLSPVPEPVGLR